MRYAKSTLGENYMKTAFKKISAAGTLPSVVFDVPWEIVANIDFYIF